LGAVTKTESHAKWVLVAQIGASFCRYNLIKAGERTRIFGMKAGRGLIGVMGLLAAVSLCSFADGLSAPRITLTAEDQPLTSVLERIAEQAGVAIVMTNEAAGRESVSLRVRNAELENALDQALRAYNYTLSFSAEQNVISKVVIAVQEKKEGVVVASTVTMPQALLKPIRTQPVDESKMAAFPTGAGVGKTISVKEVKEALAAAEKKRDRESELAFPVGGSNISVAVLRQLMSENKKRSE
jgi:hypothetical protein